MVERESVRELREKLPVVRDRLAPTHVIIFGSVARGQATADSDLDVIFVSDAFTGVRRPDRPKLIFDLLWRDFSVDALCYTPDEFEARRTMPGIVKTACEEGIWL